MLKWTGTVLAVGLLICGSCAVRADPTKLVSDVKISAHTITVLPDGTSQCTGDVVVRGTPVRFTADSVRSIDGETTLEGHVQIEFRELIVKTDRAIVAPDGTIRMSAAYSSKQSRSP
jgi:hypothetical protein